MRSWGRDIETINKVSPSPSWTPPIRAGPGFSGAVKPRAAVRRLRRQLPAFVGCQPYDLGQPLTLLVPQFPQP